MSKISGFIKNNFLLLILFIVFSILFFFRMDWNTLVSWDEAWYGSIAREMLRTSDWMKMIWNGRWYYDHPPMGFWLIAASYKLFGISEFSTRLPSVICGIFTIILVYLTSIELFKNKYVGFVAGLIMGSTVWYFIRVRSGNLDSVFVFFYIFTIYLSVKASQNFRWFPLAMTAFGGLILSKTLVGFSAGILIFFLNLKQIINWRNWIWLLIGIGAGIVVAYPWYYLHMKTNPLFIEEHFLIIGTRNKTISSYFELNATLPLFYLHMGVRKWYYLWFLGFGLIGLSFRFIKKQFFFLLLWNFVILYPFLTSDKSQIWHLIPVYLPMVFIISSGIFFGTEAIYIFFIHRINQIKFFKKYRKCCRFLLTNKNLILTIPYIISFILLTIIQINIFYKEVYPTSKYIPDDVDISKRAGKYNSPIYLDDDFLPIAVFYSNKQIITLISLPDNQRSMLGFFKNSDEKNFTMITRNWALDGLKIENIPYKILEKNNSFSIVTR